MTKEQYADLDTLVTNFKIKARRLHTMASKNTTNVYSKGINKGVKYTEVGLRQKAKASAYEHAAELLSDSLRRVSRISETKSIAAEKPAFRFVEYIPGGEEVSSGVQMFGVNCVFVPCEEVPTAFRVTAIYDTYEEAKKAHDSQWETK